jgi:hypothetical protein
MTAHRVQRSALTIVLLLLGSNARADPVPVLSGFFHVALNGGPLFHFRGYDFRLSGTSDPFGFIALRGCRPCSPEDLIDFRVHTGDDFALASGRVGGTPYNPLFLEGTLTFDAPAVAASALLSDLTLTVPFVFTGNLSGYTSPTSGIPPPPVFQLGLSGNGRVLASFTKLVEPSSQRTLFEFSSATYHFEPTAPVPEPGTGLLLCLGLAAWARHRRRLSKTRSEG